MSLPISPALVFALALLLPLQPGSVVGQATFACPASVVMATVHLRSRTLAWYTPLDAAMAAFIVCAVLLLVIQSTRRLRRQVVFWVALASAALGLSGIFVAAYLAAYPLFHVDLCVRYNNNALNMVARSLRTVTPWVADCECASRSDVLYTSVTC